MRRTTSLARGGQYAALFLFLVFLGFPLLWLISVSLKTSPELNSLAVNLIPSPITFENYIGAFTGRGLILAAMNSIGVALASTIIVMIISVPGAYILARARGFARKVGTGWILVSQIMPVILIIIPLFLILKTLGLIDSLVGLTIVYIVFTLPFSLWMLQGFIASIPIEMEEAGAIDGANKFTVLYRLIFPVMRPGLIATSMFTFVMSFNEFFFALVLLQNPKTYTLPVALAAFVGSDGRLDVGPLAAAAVLASIPSVIFFGILQRRLGSGLLAGSVKG
ncbi:carbohydrate ABC transporter permease [Arthrobacter sp. Soil761]|uniref:carbohydrate ABC transporter permease n=1 Tax=Arthrobacter sp. Soil761 TaxID=1736400 RepID=UPI0006F9299A|nr:carbohydrate ABC transporter permease [Arthrobacter sp. Soil761]KRE76699.1 sugar ABC transporter permease [Arthrobacter sp. Soil761]